MTLRDALGMEPEPMAHPPMERGIALVNACITEWTPDAAKPLAAAFRAAGATDRDLGNELLNIAVRLLVRLEDFDCDPSDELLALAVESDAPWAEFPDDDDPGED